MTKKNLRCPKKIGKDQCEGELILIDGSEARARLRCNKCDRVTIHKMSLAQFIKFLKDMEDLN